MRLSEIKNDDFFYHDQLNPLLWENDRIKTEVGYKLTLIVQHFVNFLKMPQSILKDIIISGSNAAYGYNRYSDIDLHLLIEYPQNNVELRELYTAKKNQYNMMYNIKVKDIDVELYVQDIREPHYSAGVYSILHDKWIKKPKHQPPTITRKEIINKSKNYSSRIMRALQSSDLMTAQEILNDLKNLRRSGLEKGGEESLENLTFKMLRSRGLIDQLKKHIIKLESAELSLGEQNED